MRSFATAALSLAVVAFAASVCNAQGRQPGGPPQQPTGPALLLNKSVQDELKLTDAQKDECKKIADKRQEDMRKAFQDAGMDREKMQAAMKEVNEAVDKAATKVADGLKDDQKKRFKQLQVQVKGIKAFEDEDVAKTLKLTDKQKDDIKAQDKDLTKDIEEIRKDIPRGDAAKREEANKKIAELTVKANDKIVSGLNDDQKKAWKELTGEKFDYKPEPFGGGRPGKDKGKGDKSF